MRDHHFQMLSMKYFLKWRDRHWVNFEFFDKKPTTMPTFNFPTPYSIRMQPIDGTWCFPISDLPEPALLEGGRPIDGKPTGEWIVCAPAKGEVRSANRSSTPLRQLTARSGHALQSVPKASRDPDAATTATTRQIERWKKEKRPSPRGGQKRPPPLGTFQKSTRVPHH